MSKESTNQNLTEIQTLKSYCMKCRDWVKDAVNHECSIRYRALIDHNMAGIVDRLYNLGIVPMTVIFDLNSASNTPGVYRLSIHIDLDECLKCEVLGALPEGWEYCWESGVGSRIHVLSFTDYRSYTGVEDAEKRVSAVIKEFEEFLDDRDAEGVRSLILLSGC
jgi:hypothetical protein